MQDKADCRKKPESFAASFYTSAEWRRVRSAYAASRSNLCERCLSRGLIVPGDEVHHKQHLTPESLADPDVAFNWDNLELLCKSCHLAEHHPQIRWRCDENGHVDPR